jgi:hypothetical protein
MEGIMIEIDVEQLSPEWFSWHLGVFSASKADMLVTPKGNVSGQWRKYAYLAAAELYLGRKEETFSNYHTRRGIALEPEARDLYRAITGLRVREPGICFKDEEMDLACSPDGFVTGKIVSIQKWTVEYFEFGLEIKCPTLGVHMEYLDHGGCPSEYYPQVQFSMWVTGMDRWDFMSYYPGMPPHIATVRRDDEVIDLFKDQTGLWRMEMARLANELEKY